MEKKIASFPHMGNYHVIMKYVVNKVLEMEVLTAPPITKKTIELGAKYSPEFVCVPFKYNLGNYIESLEKGANVLIQAGGGCRFGYYGETQEQILKDLGYEFHFFNINDARGATLIKIYDSLKALNPNISARKFFKNFRIAMRMFKYLDEMEDYIRKNIGFEAIPGSLEKVEKKFLGELSKIEKLKELDIIYNKYKEELEKVEINKPKDVLKVGVVGELYVLMEPFSNYFLEKELASYGIEVHRYITVSHLLKKRRMHNQKLAKTASEYLKYHLGADGTESVVTAKELAEQKFDGVIHIKPFGCMPEVNAMPMLQRISTEYKMPVLYFSFDSQTSETGIKTRIEAFYDMLTMKNKEKI